MKLPILMATCDTPQLTCLSICTYFACNTDVESEFHIGSAVDEEPTKKLLAQLKLNIPIHTYKHNSHGYILNCLYKEFATESKYFMTLDSDVEFLQPGYVSAMIKMLDETKQHYCVSTHKTKGYHNFFPRVQPFVCLWRNDDAMKKAMELFGMLPAEQWLENLYLPGARTYDVAGLISNCMEVCGRTIGILPGKSVRHFGAGSHANRNDKQILSHCENKLHRFMLPSKLL